MKPFPITPLKKAIAYFLMLLVLLYVVQCSYYKVNKVPGNEIASVKNIGKIHNYFIIHQGNHFYSLENIELDTTHISGNLNNIQAPFYYYKGRGNDEGYRYKIDEHNIVNEVHIFLKKDTPQVKAGQTKIPLEDIREVRIIDPDTGKTIAANLLGTIGVLAGIFVIFVIIIALTKSSCPYIYVHDGEGFVFEGETYGGAIAQNLARHDYLPLPSIKAKKEIYRIRISNELKERQYTDLAELMVVNHPKDQNVLLDQSGQPHLIGNPQSPINAKSYSGYNLQPAMKEKDKKIYFFNDGNYKNNGVVMKFNKPATAKQGKLLLHGKNTLWFDYLFGEFLGKFGGYYHNWMAQQEKISTSERRQRSIEQNIPLSIYIKKQNEWQKVDLLLTIGPLASRDFVIPIDISEIKAQEVAIKVETGFMFWQLDYAAMDFTENVDLEVRNIKPSIAIGTGSKDWTNALEKTDSNYMAQEEVGEVTEIIYKALQVPKEQEQSVFLHTKGYYELIRDFKGLPEITELRKFREPGYFSKFSKARYLKILGREEELASVVTK